MDRVYVDHASGATDSRPALDEMLGQLRPGDTVVIWRLDRLGRSLRHLIDLVAELEQRGVGLCSLSESIDTSTPAGSRRLAECHRGRARDGELSRAWRRRCVREMDVRLGRRPEDQRTSTRRPLDV